MPIVYTAFPARSSVALSPESNVATQERTQVQEEEGARVGNALHFSPSPSPGDA